MRSTPSIDDGRVIRIAPFGSVLKATGNVRDKGVNDCCRWFVAVLLQSRGLFVLSWVCTDGGRARRCSLRRGVCSLFGVC